jgi:hypothetical protein
MRDKVPKRFEKAIRFTILERSIIFCEEKIWQIPLTKAFDGIKSPLLYRDFGGPIICW